ncbi:DUF2752 domain-containing protein [Kitasatospora sp. NBC_00240]|uniref:DUF2752 domain-containing protein n=1 Tax=Kitasatospora sp. NBC_00240 TaxID=2903567 RepID=UPI00225ABF30|nr:DUF2752 domain-containing protein [Kitasatospora sp. NBC_00240]MCX5213522.1 DUF2752 domain-containing protein [Kitasatospora sp. NBC_00240]
MNAAPATPAPGPSVLRRLGRPLGALAALAAPTLYVASVDPNAPGHYPTCPLLQATGWWCPGCGGLRSVHALSHGDLLTAAHDNILLVALAALLAVLWCRWVWAALTGGRAPAVVIGGRRAVLLGLLLVVFMALRNLPVGAGLAPPGV